VVIGAAAPQPLAGRSGGRKNEMKKRLLLIVLGMAGIVAIGADYQDPELMRVVVALTPSMATLSPIPEVKTNGQSSLTISYRAQTFKIHGSSMTGEFSKEAHDEIGPTFKGFVLFIHVQPKGQFNQACTPHTLQRPYWRTYIQVTPVAGSDKQLYWGLSYGSRADTNLLAQLRQAIEELKDKPNQAAEVATPKDDEPGR
jgi:hypothetical protein